MLFRLQRLGVDVGNRWEELADKAEARIGDCLSAFTLPHWVMALTAFWIADRPERLSSAGHLTGPAMGRTRTKSLSARVGPE